MQNIEERICFAQIFTNTTGEEEEIYPVTVQEIAAEQQKDETLKSIFRKKAKAPSKISLKVIDDVEILVYNENKLVIPSKLQSNIIQWYHHYLQHPGHTRLEETLSAALYWPGMRKQVRAHVKRCHRCQVGKKRRCKYDKLPPKIAETTPWKTVSVDLIGPYTLQGKDRSILDFMCLTMIDQATGWFEIIELPNECLTVTRKGKEITDVVIDKSSAQISRLFNKQWLSRYPRATNVIYDNGSEFKLHFAALCDTYGIKRKPTTVKNPQANSILERIHQVFSNMMRTSGLDKSDTVTPEMVDNFITDAAWAIRSTHHSVLQSSPGAAIFGRDMLFDIPYIADWNAIGKRRQTAVDKNTLIENKRRIDYDYQIGNKVTIRKDGVLRKAEDKSTGPFVITQVFTNGTVRIQRGSVSERINIRRIDPYFETA